MTSPTEITVNQLARLIGLPDSPRLLDLCIDEDFALDPRIIPSAFKRSHHTILELVDELREYKVIVYCQKGKKISQGAAALLRTRGIDAQTLEGGQVAWRDAGLPLVPLANIPHHKQHGHSVWVTRHRPKIDRIACPWLIRRFVDPSAEFLFVAPTEVEGVAQRYDAIPFDIEEVFWSHRGEKCTFDTMLEEFQLKLPALEHVARIVRAADTDQITSEPEAAGLLAASLGLSRVFKDDLQQLEAGMLLYDCFYRWARDASNEKHNWPQADSSSLSKGPN